MSTLGSLIALLGQNDVIPYNQQEALAIRNQAGDTQGRTSLIALQEAQRQREAEARMLQYFQQNPQAALGGGAGQPPQSALGGLAAGPGAPMTQQAVMPGQPPGAAEVVPGGQDLSRFASAPPQSALGGLAAPAQPNPLEALMRQDPRVAFMVQRQQQAQQEQVLKSQGAVLDARVKVAEWAGRESQGVTDQESLDRLRTQAAQIDPQMAQALPRVYSKDAMAPFIAKALDVKEAMTLQVQDLQAQAAVIKARKEGRSTDVDNQLRAMGVPPGQETPAQMKEALQTMQQGKVDVSAAQGVGQAQQRSLGETAGRRLEAYDKTGMAGQDMHTVLDEAERLIGEGVYGNSVMDQATMGAYKRGLFQDDTKAQRTARLQELGSQLVLAHGSLGSGVSTKDAEIYAKAAGNFQQAKNLEEMQQSIQSMRTIANSAIRNANAARETYEKTGRLPAFQERGAPEPAPGVARGQPTSQAPTGGKPVAQMSAEETRAEIAAIKARGGH